MVSRSTTWIGRSLRHVRAAEGRLVTDDRFRQMKVHLGTLDDLGQQRRRLYTDWATQRLDPEDFVSRMAENLRLTRRAAEALEELLPGSKVPEE